MSSMVTSTYLKWFLACCTLCIGASAMAMQKTVACSAESGARTLPLVELYTSEGCDSCPPADRWLRETFPPDVGTAPRASVLAFHVDYWDALGWRDRFAQHEHTQRQQALARATGGRTVYTPQVTVQGRDRGLWHSGGVTRAVNDIARDVSRARVAVAARGEARDMVVDVQASITGHAMRDSIIYVALAESELASSVTAGENAGVRLVHDHVVRALVAGPAFDEHGMARGSVRIALPVERGTHPTIVAFVQQRTKGEILQSVSLPLCGT